MSAVLTEHEERDHVASDAEQHDRRRQPDLDHVPPRRVPAGPRVSLSGSSTMGQTSTTCRSISTPGSWTNPVAPAQCPCEQFRSSASALQLPPVDPFIASRLQCRPPLLVECSQMQAVLMIRSLSLAGDYSLGNDTRRSRRPLTATQLDVPCSA